MGYMKTPADEIGSYQASDCSTEYAQINKAYQVGDVPTNGNSTKKAAPTLSANQDSPAPVGNQCC